jgi:hypothetical protein
MMTSEPAVWVLHDAKARMASQPVGLAEAVGFPCIEQAFLDSENWTYPIPDDTACAGAAPPAQVLQWLRKRPPE